MYGNTETAAQALAAKLVEKGLNNVSVYDVSGTHVSTLIAESFKYSNIVLASVTYNMGIFPPMHNYLEDMKALCLTNRKITIVENGSWAPKCGSLMSDFVTKELKGMELVGNKFTVSSALKAENEADMDSLAEEIINSMK